MVFLSRSVGTSELVLWVPNTCKASENNSYDKKIQIIPVLQHLRRCFYKVSSNTNSRRTLTLMIAYDKSLHKPCTMETTELCLAQQSVEYVSHFMEEGNDIIVPQ